MAGRLDSRPVSKCRIVSSLYVSRYSCTNGNYGLPSSDLRGSLETERMNRVPQIMHR